MNNNLLLDTPLIPILCQSDIHLALFPDDTVLHLAGGLPTGLIYIQSSAQILIT